MTVFRHFRLLSLGLALACVAPALASAQEKPAGATRPAPELSQLDFFVGTFTCKGEAFKTPLSAPHAVERTITSKRDLDGFWLFMRFEDKDTQANPSPIRGNWQLAYNAKDKNFVAVWTDNLNRWFPQISAGWKDDTIAFTGDFLLNDQKASVRDTFTKKSAREMIMTVELERDGTWTRFLEFNCAK